MTIQLTEQHYIDYAMAHSQDQIKKGRQRAILWAVLFTVVGCVAIYRGAFMEGWMSEIYLVAGVLMIVFQLFNLFYNFVMFPIALRHFGFQGAQKGHEPAGTDGIRLRAG